MSSRLDALLPGGAPVAGEGPTSAGSG